MTQSYFEFAEKLAKHPETITVRTNMLHLHTVVGELRNDKGQGGLPDISKVEIVSTPDAEEGIRELIHSAVMGLAMGNGVPFSDITDTFHMVASNIRFDDVYHSRPANIEIRITFAIRENFMDNEFFAAMINRLKV